MLGCGLCECRRSPSDCMAEIAGGTLLPQQTGVCVCVCAHISMLANVAHSPSRLLPACLTHTWTWIGTEGQRLSSSWLCCASHLHTNAAPFKRSASRVPFSARVPFVLHSSVTPVSSHSLFPIRRVRQGTRSPPVWSSAVRYCKIWYRSVSQYCQYRYNTDTDTKCFVIFLFPQDRVWIFLVNRKYSSTPGVTNTVPQVTRYSPQGPHELPAGLF